MRILIVEDSDSIRHMIEALVRSRGHEVEAVSTGTRGIDAAQARTPDVVLMDVMLPDQFDGIEVCRRLKQNESTKAVPVLVISALTDDATKKRALEAGAMAFYTKPFSPTALLKEIESLPKRESSKLRAR
jgi:DNA-binding response OmpR family regulator